MTDSSYGKGKKLPFSKEKLSYAVSYSGFLFFTSCYDVETKSVWNRWFSPLLPHVRYKERALYNKLFSEWRSSVSKLEGADSKKKFCSLSFNKTLGKKKQSSQLFGLFSKCWSILYADDERRWRQSSLLFYFFFHFSAFSWGQFLQRNMASSSNRRG